VRRGRNTVGVAQLGLPGMGNPGQFTLFPDARDWRAYTTPPRAHYDAVLTEARNRAERGEDPGPLYHHLTRKDRRLWLREVEEDGWPVAPLDDEVEAWRAYVRWTLEEYAANPLPPHEVALCRQLADLLSA
jgi:hypothetical protein